MVIIFYQNIVFGVSGVAQGEVKQEIDMFVCCEVRRANMAHPSK